VASQIRNLARRGGPQSLPDRQAGLVAVATEIRNRHDANMNTTALVDAAGMPGRGYLPSPRLGRSR
jgi:hypothetical protein